MSDITDTDKIARMMLRDPAYVFMDEPTSHMDQHTEARVIHVLGEWLRGRTVVLATHRLQLLVWIDRIAVLDRGQVLIEGPRDLVLQQLQAGVSTGPRHEKAASRETRQTARPNGHDIESPMNGPLQPTV